MDSLTKMSQNGNFSQRNGFHFKLVPIRGAGEIKTTSLEQMSDLIFVDVYEGYKKIGRYKISDARLKFK